MPAIQNIRTKMKISETKRRQFQEQGGMTALHRERISEAYKRRNADKIKKEPE